MRTPSHELTDSFTRLGYTVVPAVFDAAERRSILHGLWADTPLSPLVWQKGAACSSPALASLARHDRIVEAVQAVVGRDVVLWGASRAVRQPGVAHGWHSDAEACGAPGFAGAWLGLANTRPAASLRVVPGSHRFGPSVQEQARRAGLAGAPRSDADVLAWARAFDAEATIEALPLRDGDLLLFDGRLWHGSVNPSRSLARRAVLLQYAAADRPVRLVLGDPRSHPWRFVETPRPPCIPVRGRADPAVNAIHPGPVAYPRKDLPVITNLIAPIEPATGDLGPDGKQSVRLLRGPSPDLKVMSAHYSTLAPGASPHLPHIHDEEELLVVVSGRARLEVERAAGSGTFESVPAERGDLAYYPRGWHHTLHNDGAEPLVYLMFKWTADEAGERAPLEHTLARSLPMMEKAEQRPDARPPRLLFQGPTRYLRKLNAHWTLTKPGGGYQAHADAYDVGIVLLEGVIETLGQRVEAPAFLYHAAGQLHGLRNPGDAPSRHVAFEFHGRHGEVYRPKRQNKRRRPLRRRIERRLRRARRRIARRLRRVLRGPTPRT